MGSDREVVNGAGDADGPCTVLFLLLREAQGMKVFAGRYSSGQEEFWLLGLFASSC